MKAGTDAKGGGPRALTHTDEGERCRSWALHLPWPRALPASDLLAGLRKPPLQHPRRWGPGRMVEQGGSAKGHRMARPGMGSTHHRERASECPLSRKESEGPPRARHAEGEYVRTRKGCDPVKDTHLWRPQRNRYIGTPEGCDLARGAEELGPEEGGTCRERERVRASEGHSPLEAAEEIRRDTGKKLARGAEVWKASGRGYTPSEGRRGRDAESK